MSDVNTVREIFKLYMEYPISDDKLTESFSEGDYCAALLVINKHDRFTAFKESLDYLPHEHIYQLFTEVYCDMEYGFNRITKKVIDKIIQCKPPELINKLKVIADAKNCINIFRGESTKSTPLKRALSWTLDYNQAVWFAGRLNFSKVGRIYTANVHINDVIAYILERSEDEILARYKDLTTISYKEVQIFPKP